MDLQEKHLCIRRALERVMPDGWSFICIVGDQKGQELVHNFPEDSCAVQALREAADGIAAEDPERN